ncbi:MAG: DNA ligase [Crocinitomicaceae bacterium]|nr:DNA ligase [Crocinitomicaceae bacterium]
MGTSKKLSKYKEKRNTDKSGEPEGKEAKSGKNRFSIQKHNASNLHYDLRIECDGVLKSWAIPKGPSTDTSVKRLAIKTEDHPVDYLKFEGVIPEGEYGAGEVLLWDVGTFENITKKDGSLKPLKEAIKDGHFMVNLKGEKLKGGYALTRINEEKEEWLLVKMDDDKADARRKPTSTETESVKSGKTIEDIEE